MKKPGRSTDDALLVRMTSEQRAVLEAACRHFEKLHPGARMGVGPFMLAAGLAAAADLPPEEDPSSARTGRAPAKGTRGRPR